MFSSNTHRTLYIQLAAHLKLGDDGVVHILLLFPQEVAADGVEGVGSKLGVPQEKLTR